MYTFYCFLIFLYHNAHHYAHQHAFDWTRIARIFFTDSDTLKSVAPPHRKACGQPKNDAILSYYATPHLYQTHHSELLFHFSLCCVTACLLFLLYISIRKIHLRRIYSHISANSTARDISLMVELKQGKMCIFSKCAVRETHNEIWSVCCGPPLSDAISRIYLS